MEARNWPFWSRPVRPRRAGSRSIRPHRRRLLRVSPARTLSEDVRVHDGVRGAGLLRGGKHRLLRCLGPKAIRMRASALACGHEHAANVNGLKARACRTVVEDERSLVRHTAQAEDSVVSSVSRDEKRMSVRTSSECDMASRARGSARSEVYFPEFGVAGYQLLLPESSQAASVASAVQPLSATP